MAEYSYNGWLASANPKDFGGLQKLVVAGEDFAPGVRAGDVHTVLEYVAQQLHARVEPVHKPGWHEQDDWGYSYRKNRNANNLSCHASGTAIDFNATRHPNGKRHTFSVEQVAEIRRILAEVNNVVKWGGDFSGTADEMHFEISGTVTEVARAAEKIRGHGQVPARKKKDHSMQNFPMNPTGDQYYVFRLNCPVGVASAVTARAFLSASVLGPQPGHVKVWFQSDRGGISATEFTIDFQDGRSERKWVELPDGTTTLNIHYRMPDGGVLTLETMGK